MTNHPSGRINSRARRPTATVDPMIAAVARSQGASVVTRNAAAFTACGVTVVNPWDAPQARS